MWILSDIYSRTFILFPVYYCVHTYPNVCLFTSALRWDNLYIKIKSCLNIFQLDVSLEHGEIGLIVKMEYRKNTEKLYKVVWTVKNELLKHDLAHEIENMMILIYFILLFLLSSENLFFYQFWYQWEIFLWIVIWKITLWILFTNVLILWNKLVWFHVYLTYLIRY